MQITIDDMLKGLCPEIRLGVISYNARVCEKCDDLWLFMQQNTLKTVRGRLADAPVSEYANIAEARAAYRAFGQDPTRYRVSSEALLRRNWSEADVRGIMGENFLAYWKRVLDA